MLCFFSFSLKQDSVNTEIEIIYFRWAAYGKMRRLKQNLRVSFRWERLEAKHEFYKKINTFTNAPKNVQEK